MKTRFITLIAAAAVAACGAQPRRRDGGDVPVRQDLLADHDRR
ncbi:MAG: hypothetical protein AB7I08_08715 [Thermoleophilia bacterium]